MGKGISIDRRKRLREEPHTGHNRWHPDIAPLIEVEPGEEVALETRDASDLQIGPRTTVAELAKYLSREERDESFERIQDRAERKKKALAAPRRPASR